MLGRSHGSPVLPLQGSEHSPLTRSRDLSYERGDDHASPLLLSVASGRGVARLETAPETTLRSRLMGRLRSSVGDVEGGSEGSA